LAEICGLPGRGDRCEAPRMIQAVGYSEPSYVMTTGTQNLHPPETVVALPDRTALPSAFLINLEDEEGAPALAYLRGSADLAGLCITESRHHYGINYSNGDPVHFVALRFAAPPCAVVQAGR
ncbi:MAG: glycosyltransferase family 39 protein, partial [Pseudomonadota bacterium]